MAASLVVAGSGTLAVLHSVRIIDSEQVLFSGINLLILVAIALLAFGITRYAKHRLFASNAAA